MKEIVDKSIDFQYGWKFPSCDKAFNPKIDECKCCNYLSQYN